MKRRYYIALAVGVVAGAVYIIFSGSRLYMLMALFSSARAVNDQDVSRLFDSFSPSQSGSIPGKLSGNRKNAGKSALQR